MEKRNTFSSNLPQNKDKMLIHAARHTISNTNNNNNKNTTAKTTATVFHPALPRPVFKTSNIKDEYSIESSVLARGRFARVKRCKSKSNHETNLCVKIVGKRRSGKDLTEDLHHEIAILQLAKAETAKYIAEIFSAYDEFSQMFLVLKYYEGGELWDHLPDKLHFRQETHTVENYRRIMIEISRGLNWLHDNKIVHLDIKPQNIFLDTNCIAEAHAVIADFGFSRVLDNTTDTDKSSQQDYRTLVGTPDFCSPEVLKYQPITLKADIFSLGVTFYIMLTGESPFYDEVVSQIMTNVQMACEDYDFQVFQEHAALARLIKSMLDKKAVERPDCQITLKMLLNEDNNNCNLSDCIATNKSSNSLNSVSTTSSPTSSTHSVYNSSLSDKENKLELSSSYPESPVITALPKSRRASLAVKRPADDSLETLKPSNKKQ